MLPTLFRRRASTSFQFFLVKEMDEETIIQADLDRKHTEEDADGEDGCVYLVASRCLSFNSSLHSGPRKRLKKAQSKPVETSTFSLTALP